MKLTFPPSSGGSARHFIAGWCCFLAAGLITLLYCGPLVAAGILVFNIAAVGLLLYSIKA